MYLNIFPIIMNQCHMNPFKLIIMGFHLWSTIPHHMKKTHIPLSTMMSLISLTILIPICQLSMSQWLFQKLSQRMVLKLASHWPSVPH